MKTVVKTIELTDHELQEYHRCLVDDNHSHEIIGKVLRALFSEIYKEKGVVWNSIARKAGYDSDLAMHRAGVHPLIDWARGVIDVVSNKKDDTSAERTRRDEDRVD